MGKQLESFGPFANDPIPTPTGNGNSNGDPLVDDDDP